MSWFLSLILGRGQERVRPQKCPWLHFYGGAYASNKTGDGSAFMLR